jgi:putative DNA-invertase from lambdoid prophage Rac
MVLYREQQVAIRDMLAMQASGASLRAIAEAMKARGHSISHNAVREITARVRSSAPIS